MKKEYAQPGHVALARYAVIAPLVCRELTKKEFDAEARRVVAATHWFPQGDREQGVKKRVSGRNLRRWVRWYKDGRHFKGREIPPGLEALTPPGRADRGKPRVLTAELVERAIRLRAEEPSRNTAGLVELLQAEAIAREEEPPDILEPTLAYHLRARGATRKKMKQESSGEHRRFQHAHRNDCWQGDMTGGFWLPNPVNPKKLRQCWLHAIIDDRTRYVPTARFYFRANLVCHCDCFRHGVIAGGKPSIFYCDHGSAYQAAQAQRMAARLGIQVVFATEYRPEGKGKIERFWKTVKESFYPEARRAGIQTLTELNEFFWGWLDRYHDTVHSETDATPRALWEAEAGLARWPEPAKMAEAFLWEVERKVDKVGCISISDNAYPVSEWLVGQYVSVLFDPFDLSSVRIHHNGVFVDNAKPQELRSHTFRKAMPRRTEKPAPLESARTYREHLSKGFRQKLLATVQQNNPGNNGNSCLTVGEFAAILAEMLGARTLSSTEQRLVADFFHRYAPLPAAHVRQALRVAVEAKGTQLHVRFYLDVVRTVRLERKGDAS